MINTVVSLENKRASKATPNDLMTVKEIANELGCSDSNIYKMFYNGEIKRYKRGRYKVSFSEVLRALGG